MSRRKPQGYKSISENIREAATVPTALSLSRVVLAPWAYKTVTGEPGENFGYLKIFVLIATDLEGNLARLGRLNGKLGEYFTKLGFRESTWGAKADPVGDTTLGLSIAAGGLKSGIMPRKLTEAIIAQKIAKSAVTLAALAGGKELKVSNIGKAGEASQSIGMYGFIAAEAINDPAIRSAARLGSYILAGTGFTLATAATVGYIDQAMDHRLPAHITEPLNALDAYIGKFTPK